SPRLRRLRSRRWDPRLPRPSLRRSDDGGATGAPGRASGAQGEDGRRLPRPRSPLHARAELRPAPEPLSGAGAGGAGRAGGPAGGAPVSPAAGAEAAGRPIRVALVIGQLHAGGSERQLYELATRLPGGPCVPLVYCLSQVVDPYGAMLESAGVTLQVFPRRRS